MQRVYKKTTNLMAMSSDPDGGKAQRSGDLIGTCTVSCRQSYKDCGPGMGPQFIL